MHDSSQMKAKCFVEAYAAPKRKPGGDRVTVLDIGSKAYNAHDTFRSLFPDSDFAYTGLDMEAGLNVDIVPANGYVWTEIADDSFDVVISGQTFEHNPCFWVTFSEMARVLKPGGHLFVIAPGAGPIHRYPYDCWRFYPDSWGSLCTMTGMTLEEAYLEGDITATLVTGGFWRDSAVIASKPQLEGAALAAFNDRLRAFAAPYATVPFDLGPNGKGAKIGPAFGTYLAAAREHGAGRSLVERAKSMGRQLRGDGLSRIQIFEGPPT